MKQSALLLWMVLFFQLNGKAQETQCYIQDPKAVPREHAADFTHTLIDIRIVPEMGKVVGSVTHQFEPLRKSVDSLFIDGPGISVKTARLDQKSVQWKANDQGITFFFDRPLSWGTEHELEIDYEAYPRKGMYFIGWNDSTDRSRKQIWTQGQGIDNRHWFPHYDQLNDKVITETRITFDEGYKVLSNGQLKKKKKNRDGTITWHYAMEKPHASYLVMIGIGKYNIKTLKSKSGIPIHLYYYTDWENRVDTTYTQTLEMFNWFEEYIGVNYPWKSYSQIPVQNFLYGAMENTTATVFGDFFFTDERGFLDRNYVYVNAHEFAHQWFGDLVTARSSEAHWLHESFATYYHGLWHGEVFGEDAFDWMMRNNQITALAAAEEDDYPIRDSRAGSSRHYMKGAFVLKMLNYVLGEEAYQKVIRDYLNAHAYQQVDTEDLLTQIHTTLGVSLNRFFDQWVYRGGEPHYEVFFNHSRNRATFQVYQRQQQTETVGLFEMPIEFEVHLKSGEALKKRVRIKEALEVVEFDLPEGSRVDYVLFDPNSELLKRVTLHLPDEYFIQQLANASNMLDRYDALVELRTVDFERKKEALQQAFQRTDHHAVRGEAIAQLAAGDPMHPLIREALTDKDHEVRRAALNALNTVPTGWLTEVEQLLNDPSYVTIELALDVLMRQELELSQKVNYLNRLKSVQGNNHKNVRLAWIKYQLLINPSETVEAELIDYLSPSFEFITRQRAADLAVELNVFNKRVFKSLVNGALNANRKLAGNHKKAIRTFAERLQQDALLIQWLDELELSDANRTKILRLL